MADNKQPIIKKIKKVSGHGHHGGAWKVAYADFVTAMMAFFLLLWLLSSTTDEQKVGISDYFNQTINVHNNDSSGANGLFGGKTPSPENQISAVIQPMIQLNAPTPPKATEQALVQESAAEKAARQEAEREAKIAEIEEAAFDEAEQAIKQAIESMPELKQLSESLIIDRTPEGLRIQIVDQKGQSMFASGSAEMLPQTEKLLDMIVSVVKRMPNKLSIVGHTDATPFSETATYTNWELSADRANASRRELVRAGLPDDKIAKVGGYADKDLLVVDDPTSPRNRRISIVLLKHGLENSLEGLPKDAERSK